MGTQIE